MLLNKVFAGVAVDRKFSYDKLIADNGLSAEVVKV